MVMFSFPKNLSVGLKVLYQEGATVDVAKVIKIKQALFLKNLDGDRIPLRDARIINIIDDFNSFVKIDKEDEDSVKKKAFVKCTCCKKTSMSKKFYEKYNGVCPQCSKK